MIRLPPDRSILGRIPVESAAVVPRDLLLAEPEEPGRVVVEDVPLLLLGQERGLLDYGHGPLDHPRPVVPLPL